MMTPADGWRIPKLVNKANFGELRKGEVRRIPLPKLSEKGYEQRSEREFGRYREEEIGPWVVCRATLQALSTLFGQFQKRNSANFALQEFCELLLYRVVGS